VTLEQAMFYIFAAVGIGSAVMVVTRRNPIISALFLILNFFCLAGIYLTLHAQFIAIIQILVYAGAIMVLVVFVIMLLSLGDEEALKLRVTWRRMVAIGLVFGLLMELIYIFMMPANAGTVMDVQRAITVGEVEYLGLQLFTRFLFPFEITSILLTAAIVGAIVLAKKNLN
jgi:NADH-quinone oxidoreductase subunit J